MERIFQEMEKGDAGSNTSATMCFNYVRPDCFSYWGCMGNNIFNTLGLLVDDGYSYWGANCSWSSDAWELAEKSHTPKHGRHDEDCRIKYAGGRKWIYQV